MRLVDNGGGGVGVLETRAVSRGSSPRATRAIHGYLRGRKNPTLDT